MNGLDIASVSCFAGVGMLDLGVELAVEHLGGRCRPLVYCERDAYASNVLLARMEGEALVAAPIWSGDIEQLPRDPFRDRANAAVGGFPCSDISLAGRGEGIRGKRSGLWFAMLDLACDLGCEWLFLENVAAVTVRGMDAVLGSLAEVGFDAEWRTIPAAAVGASHKRDRWFCLAHRNGDGFEGKRESGTRQQRDDIDDSGNELGDADESRRQKRRDGERLRELAAAERAGDAVANTEHGGLNGRKRDPRRRSPERTSSAWSSGAVFAPSPNHDWRGIIADYPHLAPATQPGVRVLADGLACVLDASRADQLRCCGNGVVPLQAAVAFVELFRRFGITRGIQFDEPNDGFHQTVIPEEYWT